MSFEALLIHTAVVKRVTRVSDGAGGLSETWAIVYPNVSCYIEAVSGAEARVYGAEKVPSTHRMFCKANITITAADKIVFNGVEYDVQFVDDASNKGHHLEIDLRVILPAI